MRPVTAVQPMSGGWRRDRAHEEGERAALLHRGVDEHVGDDGDERQKRGESVRHLGQHRDGEERDGDPEAEGHERLHPAGRQRPFPVRRIRASISRSMKLLSAFAAPTTAAVPRSVRTARATPIRPGASASPPTR